MRYWATARSLGMTEEEFQLSTLAKVVALWRFRRDLDRRRDFFPAQFLATYINAHKGKESRSVSVEDILAGHYGKRKRDKIDPDRGAQGDWRELKASMKNITKRRSKLRKYIHPKDKNGTPD